MSRDEQERLRDIQDAIAAIHKHLEQANETSGGAVKHLALRCVNQRPRFLDLLSGTQDAQHSFRSRWGRTGGNPTAIAAFSGTRA
jgi:hypothetical protein